MYVDTGELCLFNYQDAKAQLCFTAQVKIENFPNLDLGTSVILDIEKSKARTY